MICKVTCLHGGWNLWVKEFQGDKATLANRKISWSDALTDFALYCGIIFSGKNWETWDMWCMVLITYLDEKLSA